MLILLAATALLTAITSGVTIQEQALRLECLERGTPAIECPKVSKIIKTKGDVRIK